MSSNAIGEIRAIANTKCPDAREDYIGHKLWWTTLLNGYESFVMSGVNDSKDHKEKIQSIREFSGFMDHYMKDWPEWDLVKLRLARLCLYKNSYTNDRISPSDKFYGRETKYKASMDQYRREFLSRMGISNGIMEACCQPSMLEHRTAARHERGILDNGIIIGYGNDEEILEEFSYEGSRMVFKRTKEQLNDASIFWGEYQKAFRLPLTPFVDIFGTYSTVAKEFYKMFGEHYWALNGRRGRRWCGTQMFGGHQNMGFGPDESAVMISVVREDWMFELMKRGQERWYTKDYWLSEEGSTISHHIDYAEMWDEPMDPNDDHHPENRMSQIQFFAENCKMITAIYDDNGFVTIVDDACLDVDWRVSGGRGERMFLDCYE
jgi:hypothetical protein